MRKQPEAVTKCHHAPQNITPINAIIPSMSDIMQMIKFVKESFAIVVTFND